MCSGKQIFVTVGSTKFDQLIEQFLPTSQPNFLLKTIKELGYSKVVLQVGNSSFSASDFFSQNHNIISLDIYGFKPDLNKDYFDSDLIISHAGSGSILESLRLGKRLIVVVNDKLADNHQVELAEELEKNNHLVLCKPGQLGETIVNLERCKSEFALVPFPDQDRNALQQCLIDLL